MWVYVWCNFGDIIFKIKVINGIKCILSTQKYNRSKKKNTLRFYSLLPLQIEANITVSWFDAEWIGDSLQFI